MTMTVSEDPYVLKVRRELSDLDTDDLGGSPQRLPSGPVASLGATLRVRRENLPLRQVEKLVVQPRQAFRR